MNFSQSLLFHTVGYNWGVSVSSLSVEVVGALAKDPDSLPAETLMTVSSDVTTYIKRHRWQSF